MLMPFLDAWKRLWALGKKLLVFGKCCGCSGKVRDTWKTLRVLGEGCGHLKTCGCLEKVLGIWEKVGGLGKSHGHLDKVVGAWKPLWAVGKSFWVLGKSCGCLEKVVGT